METSEKYEGAVWEVVYIVKKGKYKNIKYLTEPDEDQLKEYEADADLLEDVPRDVRIRKSIALNVASRIMESGASPERAVETAKQVDRAFVDWLTEGDNTRCVTKQAMRIVVSGFTGSSWERGRSIVRSAA